MTDTNETLSGHCLCGAVTVEAVPTRPHVEACHCDMCRRWGGIAFMGIQCGGDVTFTGEDNIARYKSSDWAERGFCTKCGSNLFYHILEGSDYQIAAGLIDDQSRLRMSLQVFTDFKPEFYGFANETKMMTGEEVIALYAPKSE